jgi:ABC-2 type transport system ATP-binding protein
VGEGDVVEIKLEGPLDPVKAQQIESDFVSLADQALLDVELGTLTVHALDAVSALPSYLDALERSGVKVGEVRVRENTLEDVFIQLTGRRLRQ